MLGLPLAFSVPLVLVALAGLPAVWYLLRITPPRPREVAFPPLRLILDLKPADETPARTPLWLLLLRLGLAALVILAMAGPIWNPRAAGDAGRGPLLVLLDDGWSAAPDWDRRLAAASDRLEAAARDGRRVALVRLSDGARDIAARDGAQVAERLRAMQPQPFLPDRTLALPAITRFLQAEPQSDVLWISDGLASGQARPFADALAKAAGAHLTILDDDQPVLALAGAENASDGLGVRVLRADPNGPANGRVRALDSRGLVVGDARFDFAASAAQTQANLALPIELRNEISRIEIADEHAAGAVTLLDSRWKRRRIGLVSGASADTAQPLLAPIYYLTKALSPFADVRQPRTGAADPVAGLIDDQASVLVLADVGVVVGAAHDRLAKFVQDGGVLVRFAGTRLANASDDLVPVRVRRGGRVLGGALSWDTPKHLAPFDTTSPFAGLTPSGEVTVNRQVLAEPDAGLPGKTWAALEDGTPLVTAERRGKGLVVLFHVTADTTWSNLPLSGLFVDMLRRVVAMAGEVHADAGPQGAANVQGTANAQAAPDRQATVAPTRTLDGFGTLGPPPVTAKPVPVGYSGGANQDHPPGFYGPADAVVAVNALGPDDTLARMDLSGLTVTRERLRPNAPVDLRPSLVVAVFALLLADALASLWLGGGFARFTRRPALASLALLALFAALGANGLPTARAAEPGPPVTQPSARDLDAALRTRLAYVITGDAQVDAASRAGLISLSRALAARTALQPGEPNGVDPARDALVFYPLIYWPIVAGRPQPNAAAVARVATFMHEGGTIVFDTRDALTARPDGPPTPEGLWLRQLLAGVDVPELEPVPRDHVVTKTFYLLDSFVGRTTVGQTWIESLPPDTGDPATRPARAGDDVSPIVITGNDLAAAWATDGEGQPMYPLVPGGARQRELALRGGINLVMYTLTGNYKADQVHVRDLLDRLAH